MLTVDARRIFTPLIHILQAVSMSARTDLEAEKTQASTGVTPSTLTTTLKHKLEASHVDIQDLSGTTTSTTP